MFGWFFRKKDVEALKEDVRRGFNFVKKDISSIAVWIKHLDSEQKTRKVEIEDIKNDLSTIKEELEGIKNIISIINNADIRGVFKTPKQVFKKQTGVYAVQTGVQTGVQTPNFNNFSTIERAILWVLINTDLKLSYEDIASILGKERSTIRGHINRIKQKSESLIEEVIEQNGKKRFFIPEKIKEKFLKKIKVRVKEKENYTEKKK